MHHLSALASNLVSVEGATKPPNSLISERDHLESRTKDERGQIQNGNQPEVDLSQLRFWDEKQTIVQMSHPRFFVGLIS